MSKITKNQRIDKLVACLRTQGRKMRELEARLSTQEKWSDYADDMLTELNHALPDPEYDAKCEAVADVEASLNRHRERLGLNKPKLKQLDQSIFDGVDEKWRFAAVDKCGEVWYSTHRTQPSSSGTHLSLEPNADSMQARDYYDASNWRDSLIERDIAKEPLEVDLSGELTGSDLCRYLKSRKHWVLAVVSDENDATAEFHQRAVIVTGVASKGGFICGDRVWRYAVPIDHKGEPLTAAEVGL